MESHISPANIQERSDTLAAAEVKANETKPEVKAETKPEVKAEVKETKSEVKADIKPEVKSEVKSEVKETKMPNDPAELRKWATKASQESAALREEMKAVKAALEKMSKKPIDYKELAKNPDSIQKQIELERQEAIAEMQDKLQEATTRAVAQETTVERLRREQDSANYPEWKRVFPLIQNLASNTDGRINFNQKPSDVLDALYELALQLSPTVIVPPAVVTPKEEVKPVGKTAEEIAADIAAAEKRGFDKAQEALRNEQNGAGIGGAGKGARRNNNTSNEALHGMPLKDLKKLIQKE